MAPNCVGCFLIPTHGVERIALDQIVTDCRQGDEKLQDCKQRNILYESYCTVCNPEGLKQGYQASGVYVGESARSLYERAKEHHDDEISMKEGQPQNEALGHGPSKST